MEETNKGWRVYYSTTRHRFVLDNTPSRIKTNLPSDSLDEWYSTEAAASWGRENRNIEVANGKLDIQVCCRCNRPFKLNKGEKYDVCSICRERGYDMFVYKIAYNAETKKYEYVGTDVLVEDSTQKETEEYYDTEAHAREAANRRNKEIRYGQLKVEQCKDCGELFILTDREMKFYDDHLFRYPKRCIRCRRTRKKK